MNKFKMFIHENFVFSICISLIIIVIMIYFGVSYVLNSGFNNSSLSNSKEVLLNIKKYKDNEYKNIDIDKITVVNMYYKDFINMLKTDVVKSWEYIEDSSKSVYNNDVEIYKKEMAKFVNDNMLSNSIERYSFDRNIIIIDSENIQYEIYENGVWNYKIRIVGKVK